MDCVGLWRFANDFDRAGAATFERGALVVRMMRLLGCRFMNRTDRLVVPVCGQMYKTQVQQKVVAFRLRRAAGRIFLRDAPTAALPTSSNLSVWPI
jgi:hypothetical protein